MRTSRRLLLALGLALALVAGCGSADRAPGDPVTEDEARVLAGVLHRNFEAGGADFRLSAPFAEGAVLSLTGEVDFTSGTGRARAVTDYSGDRPDEERELFFSPADLWLGNVPGLAGALADAGLPAADYVRRPIAGSTAAGTSSLLDVLVQLVPRLSARAEDDPRSIQQNGYTWRGTRSVDGELASVFSSGTGATIAVSAADDHRLLQYVTRLPDQTFDVTITLSDHGPRTITLPAADDTVDVTAHPDVAAELGI